MKLANKDDKGKSGIYIITNLINNKVYIGQSIDLWTRIKEGYLQKLPKNKGHNIHLQRSWDKYGSGNFTFEVLEYVQNYGELNERETYWIHKYKSYVNSFGYNIDLIGGSPRGRKVSEERKIQQSLAVSGENNGMYGKSHTEEAKSKMSEAQSVPIVQLDKEGNFIREWKSIKDAAENHSIARTPITRVLIKKTFTSCGFIWIYKDEYDLGEFDVNEHYKKKIVSKRPIVQLDMNGSYIKEFESIRDAYRETNVFNITPVCQGLKQMAGGYKWVYKEVYDLLINIK